MTPAEKADATALLDSCAAPACGQKKPARSGPKGPAATKPPAKARKAASGPSDALEVDLEQAGRFIAALTGKSGTAVTFQTFDDGPRARPGLVQVLHGTLDQHAETLTELNGRGAGVYITINTTDGTGRKAENIKAFAPCLPTSMRPTRLNGHWPLRASWRLPSWSSPARKAPPLLAGRRRRGQRRCRHQQGAGG